MMYFTTFVLTLLGGAELAFALPQHARSLGCRELSVGAQRLLRVGGCVAIFVALFPAVAGGGWDIGLVTWFCMLSFNGFLVAMLLSFDARRIIPLIGALLVANGLGWIVYLFV